MPYDPEKHHRHSIRLRGWDYTSPAAYFVTPCVHNRECIFGNVENGEMRLNDLGQMVAECWVQIPLHFPHVKLDAYIIMPNHVHGIIQIAKRAACNSVGARHAVPPLEPREL